MASWLRPKIGGVLLDISGVLFDTGPGGGAAISGSIEAVARQEFLFSETDYTFISSSTAGAILALPLSHLHKHIPLNV